MKTILLVIALTLLLVMVTAGPALARPLDSGDPSLICPELISGGLFSGGGSLCDPYGGSDPACRPESPFCSDIYLGLLFI